MEPLARYSASSDIRNLIGNSDGGSNGTQYHQIRRHYIHAFNADRRLCGERRRLCRRRRGAGGTGASGSAGASGGTGASGTSGSAGGAMGTSSGNGGNGTSSG